MKLVHVTRKPVIRVSDQVRLKLACSATKTRWRLEILDIETRGFLMTWLYLSKMSGKVEKSMSVKG